MAFNTRFVRTLVTASVIGLGFSAVAFGEATGRAWYVSTSGNDENNDGLSEDSAFYSISSALDRAADGDVVYVAAGDYMNMTPVINYKTIKHNKYLYGDFLGMVTNGVTVIGAGEDKTILHCRSIHANGSYGYRPGGLWVENPQAKIQGLAFCGANDQNSNADEFYKEGAALHILAGSVEHCRAFNNGTGGKTYGRQPAVYVAGTGKFLDGIVTNNIMGTYGKSAAVRVDGGEVRRTLVANNGGPNCVEYKKGPVGANGILQFAGIVSDCVIRDNTSYSGEAKVYGLLAGGAYVGGGVFERCVVSGNVNPTASASTCQAAGGVYVAGTGEVRNCLVVGNSVNSALKTTAGGVLVDGDQARVLHCTVVGNVAQAGVSGLLLYGGAVAGCVVSGNLQAALPNVAVEGGTIDWSCFPEAGAVAGAGNIADDPMFSDAEAHLSGASPARDAVDVANLVADDLLGNVRPAWSAEAADIADMGCYETEAQSPVDPVAYISVQTPEARVGGTVSVSVRIDAQDKTVKSCRWELFTKDQTYPFDTGAETRLSVTDLPAGHYGVRVTVVNGDDRQGGAEKASAITVLPRKCYVSKKGENVWPYDSEASAARNLSDALAAVWCAEDNPGEVRILDGDYSGMATVMYMDTRAVLGVLDKPVKVVGNDAHPESVVLRFKQNVIGGGIVVDDPHAVLSGVTLSGTVKGHDDYRMIGCGITLVDGVVTNCHLTGCNSTSTRAQVPLSVAGGLAVDCQVFANTNGATAWKPLCMGACVSGGTLLRTRIVDNSSPNIQDADAGAGLRMTGGEARDCLIAGNYMDAYDDKLMPVAGVYMDGGRLVNCTVVNNRAGTRNEIRGMIVIKGEVVNSIVWGNDGGGGVNASVKGGSVTYTCCEDALDGVGNRTCDPLFKNAAAGDYTLAGGSPVANKGLLLPGMSEETDLEGHPRVYGRRPDLGCYERQFSSGLTISIR